MFTWLQENMELPTSNSSRDHATSMFTRLAISVNSDHNWFTGSYGPPKRRISISDDTFATTGKVALRALDSSTIISSANGYSRSRTTRRPQRMCSFRRSRSLSLRGFPSKSKTRQPGVSSLNRWSLAKCLTPDSVARSHEGYASTPRHPYDRPDNRNGSVCQLHR